MPRCAPFTLISMASRQPLLLEIYVGNRRANEVRSAIDTWHRRRNAHGAEPTCHYPGHDHSCWWRVAQIWHIPRYAHPQICSLVLVLFHMFTIVLAYSRKVTTVDSVPFDRVIAFFPSYYSHPQICRQTHIQPPTRLRPARRWARRNTNGHSDDSVGMGLI